MTSVLPGGAAVLINALKSLSAGKSTSSEAVIQMSFTTNHIRIQYFQETVAFDTKVSVVASPPPATNDETIVKVHLKDLVDCLSCCHSDGDLEMSTGLDDATLNISTSDGLSQFTAEVRLLSDSIFTTYSGIPLGLLEQGIVACLVLDVEVVASAVQLCLDSNFVGFSFSENQSRENASVLTLTSGEQKGGIETRVSIPFSAAENIRLLTENLIEHFEFSILGKDAEKLYMLLTVPGSPKFEMTLLQDAIRVKRKMLSNHDGDLIILTTR